MMKRDSQQKLSHEGVGGQEEIKKDLHKRLVKKSSSFKKSSSLLDLWKMGLCFRISVGDLGIE